MELSQLAEIDECEDENIDDEDQYSGADGILEADDEADDVPEIEVDLTTPLETVTMNESERRRHSSLTADSFLSNMSSVDVTSSENDGETTDSLSNTYSGEAIETTRVDGRPQRRVSISVKSANDGSLRSVQSLDSAVSSRTMQRRRTNVSVRTHQSERNLADSESDLVAPLPPTQPSILRRSIKKARASTRRASINLASVASSVHSGAVPTLDSAVDALGRSSNESESVAAAAAVVAEGISSSGPRRSKLFNRNDKVLVFLNILNHTNQDDSAEDFTVAPVNELGFPEGGGKNFNEQRGPWVYVLCTVLRVHFDEDVRYYTVVRADTGSEQRADTEWMEPIKSTEGLEAALDASKRTGRSPSIIEEPKGDGLDQLLQRSRQIVLWPCRLTRTTIVPLYIMLRKLAKAKMRHVIFGDDPHSVPVRLSGVNFLVLCSFTYLLFESMKYAFFPASWDYSVTVVAFIAWLVLMLELLFEWLIRPSDYYWLIESENAFAPSSARHISRFHLITEFIALLLFIPYFGCLSSRNCDGSFVFTTLDASLRAILGPSSTGAAFGRFVIGLQSLKFVGLVRHWKNLWLNLTFISSYNSASSQTKGLVHDMLVQPLKSNAGRKRAFKKKEDYYEEDEDVNQNKSKPLNEEDERLRKAANVGTALMVINSTRTIVFLFVIMTIFPMIFIVYGFNETSINALELLQGNNIMAATFLNSTRECEYLALAVQGFLLTYGVVQTNSRIRTDLEVYAMWAQVLPVRCDWQAEDGVITTCENYTGADMESLTCIVWSEGPNATEVSAEFFAESYGIRAGGIDDFSRSDVINGTDFYVRVLFNENNVVTLTNFTLFLLLISFLACTLLFLTILRGDAGRLVLNPLQRMLRIVLRYAANPLARTPARRRATQRDGREERAISSNDEMAQDKSQLGNYETEQLINAITKIADLLRKCWGIAGAGIISSNLARTKGGQTVVFNPTVPGKRVYALFGFVGINGFSELLRALDRDVMILINDVAKVVHDEVFRWALGESGQCNKNLGGAFLMVYRIGDFEDVHERQKRATDVVFEAKVKGIRKKSSNLKRRGPGSHTSNRSRRSQNRRRTIDDDTLELAALPGIQLFSDRALLGMLKAFSGLHRGREIQKWCNDFRLGAGVGAFSVEIMVGMDAGWAVEGAVGSEYKIDATYLSPHVNMAARMMTATKQYGVTILMSQAVEELLSENARSKLRHLDTVYVKGSRIKQRIFTYDARYQGVDFFLYERSDEQADQDSQNFSPIIWDQDQDLISMRRHVTDDFQEKFEAGKNQYLAGNWKSAIELLKEADDIMITTVLEEGYIQYNPDDIDPRIFDRKNVSDEILRLRFELGDGACKTLIAYMEKRRGKPPQDWNGVRPLTSK